ncbi:hypothetical protein C8Q75DRAFT_715687 [Abortiporus biennis]|nr:hypothetical protein C8Q75DRAFT_715687 [Abortiporus biennis]
MAESESNTHSHSNTETNTEDTSLRASIQDVWYLKKIRFRPTPNSPPKEMKIITQNFNGPCSFIAICNILILRGEITIEPPDRTNVSYEQLSQLVGEYLLLSHPEVDISAALSVMPYTTKGMDLNPLFTGATSFRPAGAGGELKLFQQAGIQLVHGWLVDPDSPEYEVLKRTQDYDTSVNIIVEADCLTKGRFVVAEDTTMTTGAAATSSGGPGPSSSSNTSEPGPSNSAGPSNVGTSLASPTVTSLSEEERKKVGDAIVIREFIDSTQSQLTYYGLFTLASILSPGALVALFRNSHLSVLYKSPNPEDSALYTLVSDQVFLNESSVVWERIEDVEGGASTFYDSDFRRSSPAGGDYAGHTAESALAALEASTEAMTLEERADLELARQLQAVEDSKLQAHVARRESEAPDRERRVRAQVEDARRRTKKKDCIVM